jgi:hypothetical protein
MGCAVTGRIKMANKLRTTESFHPAVIPAKEKPYHFIYILEQIPPKGVVFSSQSINVPGCSRKDIVNGIHTLVRGGYIKQLRMGMLERVLDTPARTA